MKNTCYRCSITHRKHHISKLRYCAVAKPFLNPSEAKAIDAPRKQVIVPTKAIINWTEGNKEYKGSSLATKNIPAATIVAACISAEIGVGPSIASGNQTKRNCADLAIGPRKTKKQRSKAAHIGNELSEID